MKVILRYSNNRLYPKLKLSNSECLLFSNKNIPQYITHQTITQILQQMSLVDTFVVSFGDTSECESIRVNRPLTKDDLENIAQELIKFYRSIVSEDLEVTVDSSDSKDTIQLVNPLVQLDPEFSIHLNGKVYKVKIQDTTEDLHYLDLVKHLQSKLEDAKNSYEKQLVYIRDQYESKLASLYDKLDSTFKYTKIPYKSKQKNEIEFYTYFYDMQCYLFKIPFKLNQHLIQIGDKIYYLRKEFVVKKDCYLILGYDLDLSLTIIYLIDENDEHVNQAHHINSVYRNVCIGSYNPKRLDLDNPIETVLQTRKDLERNLEIVNFSSLGDSPIASKIRNANANELTDGVYSESW